MMTTKTENKYTSKNKYYNIIKGKKENKFIFLLPTIIRSPKTFISWDTMMSSLFIGIGKYFWQYNFCEIIKDTNTEVYQETLKSLMQMLKVNQFDVKDLNQLMGFLHKNRYLVTLIKNANLDHPYIKNIIIYQLQHQPFIIDKRPPPPTIKSNE